jgi:hypothetical protein
MGTKIRIQKPVAILFPKVIKPEPFVDPKTKKPKGTPVYSANFCIPSDHPNWPELKAAVLAEAQEMFGGLKDVHFCIMPGEREIDRYKVKCVEAGREYKGENDFMTGCMILKTASPQRVPALGVWDGKLCRWIDVEEDGREKIASKFYPGALCSVEVVVMAGEFNGKYVKAYLQKVYSTGQGTRIAGGEPGSAVFEAYKGHVSNVDPTLVAEDVPF